MREWVFVWKNNYHEKRQNEKIVFIIFAQYVVNWYDAIVSHTTLMSL